MAECRIKSTSPAGPAAASRLTTVKGWKIGPIDRLAVGLLLAGACANGVVYAFFTQFSRFALHDDEGRMLIFVQHMFDGHAIYDQVRSVYGPFYLLQRWLIFSFLGVPVGNDSVRIITVATWCMTSLVVAFAAWRLLRGSAWAVGLGAAAGFASIYFLRIMTNEPGHPQELVALVVSIAIWLTLMLGDQWKIISASLGAATAALVLTKVNIGVFFGLGVVLSILAQGRGGPTLWRLARLLTLVVPAIPYFLMRPRLDQGYQSLCLVMTAALVPVCLTAFEGERSTAFRPKDFRQLLYFGAGAAVTGVLLLGFGIAQGNTLAGMYRALVVFAREHYLGTRAGRPLYLPMRAEFWSLVASALGIAALRCKPMRLLLGLLRLGFVGLVLIAVQAGNMYDTSWMLLALPLSWLLLVPPPGRAIGQNDWSIRLLVTYTVCLQPLQIFPVSGTQNHMGTFIMILAALVALTDLAYEIGVILKTRWIPSFRSVIVSLLILTPGVMIGLWCPEEHGLLTSQAGGVFQQLLAVVPSWTIVCLGLGTGTGLIALWEPRTRQLLWPLKLGIAASVLVGSLAYGMPNLSTASLIAPWLSLVLVRPPERELRDSQWIFRVFLVILINLLLRRFLGDVNHDTLGGLSALLVASILLVDIPGESNWLNRPRVGRAYHRLISTIAILAVYGSGALFDLVLFGLVFGSLISVVRGLRSGVEFKRLTIPALIFAAALSVALAVTSPTGNLIANLNRAIDTSGPRTVMSVLFSQNRPLLAIGLGLGVVWVGPANCRPLWPLRLLACGMTLASIATPGAWSVHGIEYARPLTWLVLVPPVAGEIGASGWILRLFLTLTATSMPGVIPAIENDIPLDTLLLTITTAVLVLDLIRQAPASMRLRNTDMAARWNVVAACLALMIGSQLASNAQSTYEAMQPVSFRGCRWTRMSDTSATMYRFLTRNVRASCDCMLAGYGLLSLHFWSDRPPASDVIIPNIWETLDATDDERLLAAHRDRKDMMFIATSPPEKMNASPLKFLRFVAEKFKQIARLGENRLLVRKERSGLELHNCALEAIVAEPHGKSRSVLRLRLPQNLVLNGVVSISLVDVNTTQIFASTNRPTELVLTDGARQKLLPAEGRRSRVALSATDQGLTVEYPAETPLRLAVLPALKFNSADGRCLLTLPVVVEVSKDVQ